MPSVQTGADNEQSPLTMLKHQCSHVLFVLSNAQAGQEKEFLNWYQDDYQQTLVSHEKILTVELYEKHEVDVCLGEYRQIPYQYLGIIELSLDGAEEAASIIEQVESLHSNASSASEAAIWLYYPVSEKVGRPAKIAKPMKTLAFANAIPGTEPEFREWYCTRHIRHALKVPALVSGQCFELTNFQQAGAADPVYQIIAVYEQEGTPEQMIESFDSLPEDALEFPSLDLERFAEWVYRPVG